MSLELPLKILEYADSMLQRYGATVIKTMLDCDRQDALYTNGLEKLTINLFVLPSDFRAIIDGEGLSLTSINTLPTDISTMTALLCKLEEEKGNPKLDRLKWALASMPYEGHNINIYSLRTD